MIFNYVMIAALILCAVLTTMDYAPKIRKANKETKFALADRLEKQLLLYLALIFMMAYAFYKDWHV